MIKYYFIFFLALVIAFSFKATACKLSIPDRDVARFLAPPTVGHYLKCEDYPEDKCHCVESLDPWSTDLIDNMVLDFIRKENAVSCLDEDDCLAKEAAQVCTIGKVIRTESEVYCAVEVLKADGKKLVVSEEKKAAREAAEAIKAQQQAALNAALKAMDCGKSAQAAMLVRNAAKNLTTTQVKQIVAAYAPIKGLLDTGSLQSAIEEIQAIQADGVLVTQADKEAIIAHINQCRP